MTGGVPLHAWKNRENPFIETTEDPAQNFFEMTAREGRTCPCEIQDRLLALGIQLMNHHSILSIHLVQGETCLVTDLVRVYVMGPMIHQEICRDQDRVTCLWMDLVIDLEKFHEIYHPENFRGMDVMGQGIYLAMHQEKHRETDRGNSHAIFHLVSLLADLETALLSGPAICPAISNETPPDLVHHFVTDHAMDFAMRLEKVLLGILSGRLRERWTGTHLENHSATAPPP